MAMITLKKSDIVPTVSIVKDTNSGVLTVWTSGMNFPADKLASFFGKISHREWLEADRLLDLVKENDAPAPVDALPGCQGAKGEVQDAGSGVNDVDDGEGSAEANAEVAEDEGNGKTENGGKTDAEVNETEDGGGAEAEGKDTEAEDGDAEAEGKDAEAEGNAEAEGDAKSEDNDAEAEGDEEAEGEGEDAEDKGGEAEDKIDEAKINAIANALKKALGEDENLLDALTEKVVWRSVPVVCQNSKKIVIAESIDAVDKLADNVAKKRGCGGNGRPEFTQEITLENIAEAVKYQLQQEFKENGNVLTVKKEIVINNNGVRKILEGEYTHPKFDHALIGVSINKPVYLFGPAGTGKSKIAEQIAKALNLKFYYQGCALESTFLTGFVDANGTYHETPFYKAFKDGGLFFLDEFDASDPTVGVILNEALANGRATFPNSPEMVKAHADFRVIAAGNTVGNCRDAVYTGRNPLDGATLDRFMSVYVGYDRNLEIKLVGGDTELVDFAEAFRKVGDAMGAICSYRSTTAIVDLMAKGIGIIDALEYAMVAKIEFEKRKYIFDHMRINRGNAYYMAFESSIDRERERRAA